MQSHAATMRSAGKVRTCRRALSRRSVVCRRAYRNAEVNPCKVDDDNSETVARLLELVQGTQRGLETSEEARRQIEATIETLSGGCADRPTTSDADVSATWRLLWTTERETLFILRNAGWFGTQAGEVYQVIDLPNSRLQNVIEFPPTGAFIVDSSLQVASPRRMDFSFNAATLKLPSGGLGLPPFGKGWFDVVYVDQAIRVARDRRGDTLVVARDGPPRLFAA